MESNLLQANDDCGVYPQSWYAATSSALPLQPVLQEAVSCDVCVIGAGYTGLSAALHLVSRGYHVVVLDAHRAGWGASGRNGGQLGSGQRVDQDYLEQHYGIAQARLLWNLAEQAKTLVRDIIRNYGIDCEYQPGIAHADHKSRFIRSTQNYVDKLQQQYGYEQIELIDRAALRDLLGSEAYYGGYLDHGAGHLHPLKFALGLARAALAGGAKLYEMSEVSRIDYNDPVCVTTELGRVQADHVLLACNGYLGSLQPDVASRVMPINNFIIATEPLSVDLGEQIIRNDMAVVDSRFVVNYFRKSPDKRLLFGGRESYGYRFPENIPAFVQSAMVKIYPQLANTPIEFGWGGTLAITMNRLPHLRHLAANVVTASGYSGHGVGMATLAGQVAADAIAGQMERFDVLSAIKHRKFPGGTALRSPMLKLGMLYYALRDRL